MIYADGPIEGVFVEEGGQLTTIKEVWVGPELIWQNRLPLIVHEVNKTGLSGSDVAHPLITITVPPGETWMVRVQGTASIANRYLPGPQIRIGAWTSPSLFPSSDITSAVVDENRPVTAGQGVFLISDSINNSFVGTITIDPNPV